jgi:multidrug resistance efflux pump
MALSRTEKILADDIRSGDKFFSASLLALLIGGAVCISTIPVSVKVPAASAHIEPEARLHVLAAEFSGLVVAVPAKLHAQVEADDPLLILDSSHSVEALVAANSHKAEIQRRILALDLESRADLARIELERNTVDLDAATAALQAEADAVARKFASRNLEQSERLRQVGLISENERLRLESEAARATSVADIADLARARTVEHQKAAQKNLEAKRAAFDGLISSLRGDLVQIEAHIEHLSDEVARRTLRAPISGRVGRIQALRPGSWVEAGQPLIELVPGGSGRTVLAQVDARYLARLRVGQKASLRPILDQSGGLGPPEAAVVTALGLPELAGEGAPVDVELELEGETSLVVGAPLKLDLVVDRKPIIHIFLKALAS